MYDVVFKCSRICRKSGVINTLICYAVFCRLCLEGKRYYAVQVLELSKTDTALLGVEQYP